MPRRMTTTPTPTLTPPVWAGEFLSPERLIPGGAKIDPAQFYAPDSVLVTATANAIVGATTISVTALSGPIPSGTLLDFGGSKLAITTALAAAAATSISVRALGVQVNNTDTARYAGAQLKTIPSGTVVGRTIAERDAKTAYGPAAASDDETFIVAFDVLNANDIDDVELVKGGTVVKENFLPGFSALASGVKTNVRAKYVCVVGEN